MRVLKQPSASLASKAIPPHILAASTIMVWGSLLDRCCANILPLISAKLIDTGINTGPSIAKKFLQRWLNAYNKQSQYSDLGVNGQIGSANINALHAYLEHRKNGKKLCFGSHLIAAREQGIWR